uniref:Uncharacterized protein n=1 Tax=Arundo donax TaxID=35708 RepID=A0A0A9BPK3_ARUDO
MVILLALTE